MSYAFNGSFDDKYLYKTNKKQWNKTIRLSMLKLVSKYNNVMWSNQIKTSMGFIPHRIAIPISNKYYKLTVHLTWIFQRRNTRKTVSYVMLSKHRTVVGNKIAINLKRSYRQRACLKTAHTTHTHLKWMDLLSVKLWMNLFDLESNLKYSHSNNRYNISLFWVEYTFSVEFRKLSMERGW